MQKLALAALLAALASAPAAAQDAFPNLLGTWKGDSESIVLSGGNTHHPGKSREPRMSSVPFTLTIDKQDGRRDFRYIHLSQAQGSRDRGHLAQRHDLHGRRRRL